MLCNQWDVELYYFYMFVSQPAADLMANVGCGLANDVGYY